MQLYPQLIMLNSRLRIDKVYKNVDLKKVAGVFAAYITLVVVFEVIKSRLFSK